MSEQTPFQERRDAMNALIAMNIEPYPPAWDVEHTIEGVIARYAQDFGDQNEPETPFRVRIAGRIMSRRTMGKASFVDLVDESGQIQVYLQRDVLPEGQYNTVFKRHIARGDIIGVEGPVFRTRMGELTVQAESLVLLAKSLRPLPTVKHSGDQAFDDVTDKEFRYRQRYVDLTIHPEVRRVFQMRAQMLRVLRQFLDERGYIEVETPVLQPTYGGATARPFTTWHNALDQEMFLRIADELYLKRLIVGGFEGVYEIAKDFRNEGLSRFHNPEFTMLELYVAHRDYRWMMTLVETMFAHIATQLHGAPEVHWCGQTITLAGDWPRRPFFEAITEHTGHDLRNCGQETLVAVAEELGLTVAPGAGEGTLLDAIFSHSVEPNLINPVFITDYPLSLSPLARRHRSEPDLVERFEVFIGGREIGNAFSELNDPIDQRARLEAQARLRAEGDAEAMPIDEDYLRALEYGMPPTAGLGVGIDRLAMLMTGQDSIRDVLLFPLMRPERG